MASNDPELTLSMGDTGDQTELRIVGIKLHTVIDGKQAVFPFDDPVYNPITENQYRIDLARAQGKDKALLRPYYANVDGQQPLASDEVVF